MIFDSIFNDDGLYVVRFLTTGEPTIVKQLGVEKDGIQYYLTFYSDGSVNYEAINSAGMRVQVNPTVMNKLFKLTGTESELYTSPVTVNFVRKGLTKKAFNKLNRKYGINEKCEQMQKTHGIVLYA